MNIAYHILIDQEKREAWIRRRNLLRNPPKMPPPPVPPTGFPPSTSLGTSMLHTIAGVAMGATSSTIVSSIGMHHYEELDIPRRPGEAPSQTTGSPMQSRARNIASVPANLCKMAESYDKMGRGGKGMQPSDYRGATSGGRVAKAPEGHLYDLPEQPATTSMPAPAYRVIVRLTIEEMYRGAKKVVSIPARLLEKVAAGESDEVQVSIMVPKGIIPESEGCKVAQCRYNHLPMGIKGDLYLQTEDIKHPTFYRKKYDVFIEREFILPEALFGGSVVVPSPIKSWKGFEIDLSTLVRKHPLQQGQHICLGKRGIPVGPDALAGQCGNIYLVVSNIQLPIALPDDRKTIEALRKTFESLQYPSDEDYLDILFEGTGTYGHYGP